ncbi:MAG: hypothetical protein FGF52_03915 [Candidatus Brockarchaeota archaeon]|nr:hypothetical protein [Candidatus Brockarchaeota archaeon]
MSHERETRPDEELINYLGRRSRRRSSVRPIQVPAQPARIAPRFSKGLLIAALSSFILPAAISALLILWAYNTFPYASLIIGIIGAVAIMSIDAFRETVEEFTRDFKGGSVLLLLFIPSLIFLSPFLLPIIIGVECAVFVMRRFLR